VEAAEGADEVAGAESPAESLPVVDRVGAGASGAGMRALAAAPGETADATGTSGATKRAPISKPNRNSSAHSNSAQLAAMVTIREVIEKT
jgi:hypothetical protein